MNGSSSFDQRIRETSALYGERGLGGRAIAGQRAAVIVVDLINGFTDSAFPAGSDLDEVVAANCTLLEAARRAGTFIVFTTIAFSVASAARSAWLRKMPAMRGLIEGSRWIEVDDRLGRGPDEPLVTKRAASAFGGTDLAALLVGSGVDTVIVTGATTSGCVRATAVDACMWGWPVFVPRDCVGDRAPAPHEANLFDIDAKYGDVVSLDRAITLVSAHADVPSSTESLTGSSK